MAHPMKKDSSAGQNAKLKRMTEGYGSAAGPSENIMSESASLKGEGPEEAVGFGADANAPSARRGDRSRRTSAANPVSTYRKGGAVKKRADGGDVSPITQANRNQAEGENVMGRARGGRTKTKAKGTNVNVIIAPQGGGGAGATPPPVLPVPPPAAPMMPPKPPMPPMGGPMAGGPMAGGPMGGPPLGAPGAPGGMPPGIMPPRAKGGRVDTASGLTAGAMSGEGRVEKIALQKKAGTKQPQTV